MCALQLRVEKVIWGLEESAKLKTFDGNEPNSKAIREAIGMHEWNLFSTACELELVMIRTNYEIEVSYLEDVRHMRSFVGAIQRLCDSVDNLNARSGSGIRSIRMRLGQEKQRS